MSHQVKHFPSSPARPPKYDVTFQSPRGFSVHCFCTLEATRTLIDKVVDAYSIKWLSSTEFMAGDISVRSHHLEDIMESTGTVSLPYPYPRFISDIRGDRPASSPTTSLTYQDPPASTPRAKAQAPRASRTGLTTIADICAELKIEPRIARGILRKAKIDKPAEGWAWSDPAPIAKLIKDNMK